MGMAIVLIMFCHNSVIPPAVLNEWFAISELCQVGVDIFLFLSGFGLCYSFSRTGNYFKFIKKWMVRVLPSYIIVVGIWIVFCWLLHIGGGLTDLLWKYYLISSFAEAELCEWYVAAILVLYCCYPAFYWLSQKINRVVRLNVGCLLHQ